MPTTRWSGSRWCAITEALYSFLPGIVPGVVMNQELQEQKKSGQPKSMAVAACHVCPRACMLGEGNVGACRARQGRNGVSESLNYGKVTSLALDPIEKKPLAFFHPGGRILSIGSFGCNMTCPFCQNASISTAGPTDIPTEDWKAAELAELAVQLVSQGNLGLAFTYNEPLVGYEFVRDTAQEIHARGLLTALVTNGCVSHSVMEEVYPHIDAFNIDLKVFDADAYEALGGDLERVIDSICYAWELEKHVELTTLVVPGLNDSLELMEEQAAWIAELDLDIPLHITRFFPRHHMQDAQATDIGLMEEMAQVAQKHLNRVLLGNV